MNKKISSADSSENKSVSPSLRRQFVPRQPFPPPQGPQPDREISVFPTMRMPVPVSTLPGRPLPAGKSRRFPVWSRVIAVFLVLLVLLIGGVWGYYQLIIAPKLSAIIGHQAIHQHFLSDGRVDTQGGGTPQMTVPTGNDSTLSGKNRINILLLGSDTDGKQNDGVSGSPLAQTDIVVTIDKQSGYVGMLSVPRDLQVTIPGQGENKMDFAFRYGWQAGSGDFAGHAESAAGLAEDTLAYNFGIHIDHYAWVGLQGFVKVIDTAGGVDVDILHPIVEDNYPDDVNNPTGQNIDYKRLYFAPGPQHLNGTEALEYVRTRHSDLQGDFGRSVRQQQVLNQLKMKLAQPEIIARASELLSELSGSVLTDMQPNDIIYLANLARGIDSNKIDRLTLSPPYSNPNEINTNYLPDCSQITPKISQMFDIQGTCLTQEVVGVSNDTSTVLPQATPTVTVTPSGSVSTPTSTPMSAPTPTIAPTLLPTPTPRSGRHNGL